MGAAAHCASNQAQAKVASVPRARTTGRDDEGNYLDDYSSRSMDDGII